MNLLDLLVLACLLLAAVRGYREGALSQVATFAGVALGLVVGAVLAPTVAKAIANGPGTSLALWTLGLLVGAVILGQGLGIAVGWRIRRAAHAVGGAAVDRGAGTVVGMAAVLLAVWLLAGAFARGPYPSLARQVGDSRVIGAIDDTLPQPPDVFARVGSYFNRNGFPQVFNDIGGGTAPPVDPPSSRAVEAAQSAGAASTVRVQSLGCGGVSSGSGFVVRPGIVVTNAHVVAGGEAIVVDDHEGEHSGTVIGFDPELDIAVVSVSDSTAPPIGWAEEPSQRGTAGATLGHPGGQRELAVKPASVRSRSEAVGRDIYGSDEVRREILILTSEVRPGDSGGPFVTSEGRVGGVVFAAADDYGDVGYAVTAEQARPVIELAIDRDEQVATGGCRF